MTSKIIIADIDKYAVEHEHGTIVLTLNSLPITLTDIENYNISIENGALILAQKDVPESAEPDPEPPHKRGRTRCTGDRAFQKWNAYKPKTNIFGKDLRRCKILRAKLGDDAQIISPIFAHFLSHLYSKIPKEDILQYTTLKMTPNKTIDKSHFNRNLGLYVPYTEATYLIQEIIHICKKCSVKLELDILLNNREVINYRG